ncbi:hypothetical protein [Owenweeksia hongkongensis]|uniref:hypothetical protein n=1 Tax=Owenweeksia hongkongensis TaxID=253245 RepID=UPI003A941C5A
MIKIYNENSPYILLVTILKPKFDLTKKDVKIAIFSAFLGIVFTAIYDLIKSKPILSTFWNILKWTWINIFEFQLSVWQVFTGLGVLVFLFYLFSKKQNKIEKNQFTLLDYIEDNIHGMTWSWFWEKNLLNGKWNVNDLRPKCDNCGTKMHLIPSSGIWNEPFAECPRCGKTYNQSKDLAKIEAVIIDNVHREIYPDSIKEKTRQN